MAYPLLLALSPFQPFSPEVDVTLFHSPRRCAQLLTLRPPWLLPSPKFINQRFRWIVPISDWGPLSHQVFLEFFLFFPEAFDHPSPPLYWTYVSWRIPCKRSTTSLFRRSLDPPSFPSLSGLCPLSGPLFFFYAESMFPAAFQHPPPFLLKMKAAIVGMVSFFLPSPTFFLIESIFFFSQPLRSVAS